jgi:hypothetical protein
MNIIQNNRPLAPLGERGFLVPYEYYSKQSSPRPLEGEGIFSAV